MLKLMSYRYPGVFSLYVNGAGSGVYRFKKPVDGFRPGGLASLGIGTGLTWAATGLSRGFRLLNRQFMMGSAGMASADTARDWVKRSM